MQAWKNWLPKTAPNRKHLWGLDIAEDAIRMVEISGAMKSGATGLRLERYHIHALPAGIKASATAPETLTHEVRAALNEFASDNSLVAMALPGNLVMSRTIALPSGIDANAFEMLAESEAAMWLPCPVEEVQIDFQTHESTANEPMLLVCAARKALIASRIAIAEAAGLQVAVLDDEDFALANALTLAAAAIRTPTDALIAYFEISANSSKLMILQHQEICFQQTHPITTTAHTASRQSTAELSAWLTQEINSHLAYFTAIGDYPKVHILFLSGQSFLFDGVIEALQSELGVPCHLANPFQNMQRHPRINNTALQQDAQQLCVACGLALRCFA